MLPQNMSEYQESLSACFSAALIPDPLYFLPFPLHRSVQFSSVTQSCLTLCDPMNCSTPGLPVHHQLPEFTQTHVHRVHDVIQPSHALLSPSPPAPNPSQHQSLFQWVNSCMKWPKYWSFSIIPSKEQSLSILSTVHTAKSFYLLCNISVLPGYVPLSRVKYISLKIIPAFLWLGLTPTFIPPSLMSFLHLPKNSSISFNIQNISCIAIHKSWFLHLSTMFFSLLDLSFPIKLSSFKAHLSRFKVAQW